MSRSIHITKKNLRGLSKAEIDAQAQDPQSELRQWGRKSLLKKTIRKSRKNILMTTSKALFKNTCRKLRNTKAQLKA